MDELRDYLLDCGASVVGVADVSSFPKAATGGYPRALSIALAIPPEPLIRLAEKRSRPAEAERPVCAALSALAKLAVEFLEGRGARAEAVPPDSGRISHNAVAVRAGIAWVGKSGRGVTWEYGSAARIVTVLTDADLPTGNPTSDSFCGECLACTNACPVHAPSGERWKPGMERGDFVDVDACARRAEELRAEGLCCGHCMSVCPFTAAYLCNCGYSVEEEKPPPPLYS